MSNSNVVEHDLNKLSQLQCPSPTLIPKSHSRRRTFLARNANGGEPEPSSNGYPSPVTTKTTPMPFPGKPEADAVVIGSGIGGLCCAGLCCVGLLSRYQQDVLVLESHDTPGGAAHSFQKKGYKFDSGPSLFSGFQSRGPQANPLAQVLDALGESIPCASYDSWMVYIPEGEFLSRIGPTEFFKKRKSRFGCNQLCMEQFNEKEAAKLRFTSEEGRNKLILDLILGGENEIRNDVIRKPQEKYRNSRRM